MENRHTHTERHKTNTQKYFASILHGLFLQICLAVWIPLRMKWIRAIASMETCFFVIGWAVSRLQQYPRKYSLLLMFNRRGKTYQPHGIYYATHY